MLFTAGGSTWQGGSRCVDSPVSYVRAGAGKGYYRVEQGVPCERCGALCEPDATVCFTCGAPIGELEQPTQPVRVPAHLRAPRDVPSAPDEAAVDAERVPAAEEVATGQGRPRLRRIVRNVELALIVVLIAGMGTGLTVLHYRLIPSAVPAQTLYRDPAHRFHFVQPALWQALPNADGVALGDSTGTSSVQISDVYPREANESAAHYAAQMGARLGLSAGIPVDAAGTRWEEQAGQVVATDNVTREIVVLVTLHTGQLYIIQYSSPVASFASANDLTFQPLLRSFAFG
ncbi:MAG: hypothetical protein PVSMB4_03840 [Ktedonobacterales bacterium]